MGSLVSKTDDHSAAAITAGSTNEAAAAAAAAAGPNRKTAVPKKKMPLPVATTTTKSSDSAGEKSSKSAATDQEATEWIAAYEAAGVAMPISDKVKVARRKNSRPVTYAEGEPLAGGGGEDDEVAAPRARGARQRPSQRRRAGRKVAGRSDGTKKAVGAKRKSTGRKETPSPKRRKQRPGEESSSDTIWREHFDELVEYMEQEGHTIVPKHYINEDGVRLGIWVSYQRIEYHRALQGQPSSMTQERIDLLNSLDFAWEGSE